MLANPNPLLSIIFTRWHCETALVKIRCLIGRRWEISLQQTALQASSGGLGEGLNLQQLGISEANSDRLQTLRREDCILSHQTLTIESRRLVFAIWPLKFRLKPVYTAFYDLKNTSNFKTWAFLQFGLLLSFQIRFYNRRLRIPDCGGHRLTAGGC